MLSRTNTFNKACNRHLLPSGKKAGAPLADASDTSKCKRLRRLKGNIQFIFLPLQDEDTATRATFLKYINYQSLLLPSWKSLMAPISYRIMSFPTLLWHTPLDQALSPLQGITFPLTSTLLPRIVLPQTSDPGCRADCVMLWPLHGSTGTVTLPFQPRKSSPP